MFSRQRKSRVLFALSDIVLIGLAFAAAYETRSLLHLQQVFYMLLERKVLVLGFSVFVWVATGVWLKVYEKLDSWHPRVVLRDSARQCVIGGAGVALLQYVLRLQPEISRPFVVLFAAYAWVLLVAFRLGAGRMAAVIRREFAAPHYVMVVGTGERALRMAEAIERFAEYGVRLTGFLEEQPLADASAPHPDIALGSVYQVRPIAELPSILRQRVVDEIIFAVGSDRLADLEEAFLLCDEEGVRTRVSVDFFPHVNSTISLDRVGDTPLLTFSAAPDDEVRLLVKRITDVVIAAASLVLLMPFMLVVAALIRLTSPGPAIFRQVRCGLNGRRFLFYKFRSMCENAEELKPALDHLSSREIAFKIPDDPRLTPLGRYLRKFSIDEWPQLWSVLRGDMSLVGPRPAVPGEVDRYKLDMQYIDNWSLALDWKILLRTIPRVLTGRGAN